MGAPGQRSRFARVAAWYVSGPVGHFVAGALDAAELLVRMLWQRARGRRAEWW